MTDQTETLKQIFLDVSDDGTVTESQLEEPSYEPVDGDVAADEEEVKSSVEDGLTDAIEGSDGGPSQKKKTA